MEDFNSPVFAQAKVEYTKQLIDVLKLPLYEGLQSIYSDSKQIYADNTDIELPIIFRQQIERVPKWNIDMIEHEVDRIIRVSNCDWLEDLITAVFISHTKILASLGNNSKRVNLTIPKITNFIHKCYINSAREMWKNPYLYDENVSSSEYQKNIKIIEDLIVESIEQTIRKALPVKEILKDHFEHSEIAEKRNREVDKTKELQKLLMAEIMNVRKEKDDLPNNLSNDLSNDLSNNNEKYFDDHVDEKMIQENTTNLEINDILSDNEDDVKEVVNEETYENPDIVDKPIIDEGPVSVEEKLNDYKNIIEENRVDKDEDIIVKKIDDEQKGGDTLIIDDTKIINDTKIIDETKIVDTNLDKEINPNITTIIEDKPLNDISDSNSKLVADESTNISAVTQIENIIEDDSIKKVGLGKVEEVKADDKDETMTLDNFMTDVQDLLSDNNKKDEFTLFNDAKEIES